MLSATSNQFDPDRVDYELHMRHALALAENVLTTTPNPRVGCVLVDELNEVAGEGWHQVPGAEHAEVNALLAAGGKARGTTAFVSLEPCAHHGKTPPCADALIDAGVRTVVIPCLDPFQQVAGKGIARLESAGIQVIQLTDFEARARDINRGYFKRLTRGLPFVRCKLAMSLDGRTAAANGESRWITGTEARQEVQRLRAASCAIVTGVGTVLRDDPSLSVRAEQLGLGADEAARNRFALGRQPMRVVMDSRLRTPPSARLLQVPGATKIFTAVAGREEFPPGTEVIGVAADERGQVDPVAVLESLASRFAVNEVLLEAGPTLAGAFVGAGLVDELVVYVAGSLLGSEALPLLALPWMQGMADRMELELTSVARVGKDIRIVARFG